MGDVWNPLVLLEISLVWFGRIDQKVKCCMIAMT